MNARKLDVTPYKSFCTTKTLPVHNFMYRQYRRVPLQLNFIFLGQRNTTGSQPTVLLLSEQRNGLIGGLKYLIWEIDIKLQQRPFLRRQSPCF